ncbi:MAG: hypothetical protein Q8Q09_14450 [Deltaproteobacteria bacterium]|nr:hypothetical protein [Deltaproteobacteria bacterium]
MKSMIFASILMALGAVQCGTEPIGCGCSDLRVRTANDVGIDGATIRWISHPLADNESVYPFHLNGRLGLGGPGCQPGTYEIEVRHPDYVPQRVVIVDMGTRLNLRACPPFRTGSTTVTLQPLPR